jgi:hypothetical protein
MSQKLSLAAIERNAGFIAGAFNAENNHDEDRILPFEDKSV